MVKWGKGGKAWLAAAILLLLILLLAAAFAMTGNEEQSAEEQRFGITMRQAWEIADAAAKEWSDDAVVIKIISTDYGDDENPENGINGRRNCWTFVFHSEKKGKEYDMYVRDGEVSMPSETVTGVYAGIDMESIQIDSDDAFLTAYNQGFTGGVDWAFGYHYMLQYYMTANGEPQLLMKVRGINRDGREALLSLDPYTGEIISVSEKTGYDEDGRSVWDTSDHLGEAPEENSEYVDMSREEIMEEFEVYKNAKKYYMDPEELTDAIIQGLKGDKFSPFSETPVYEKEEWEIRISIDDAALR